MNNRIFALGIFLLLALLFCSNYTGWDKKHEICNHVTGVNKVPAMQYDTIIWLPIGRPVDYYSTTDWVNIGDDTWVEQNYICEVK